MLLVIKAFEFMNMFGCIVIKHLSDDGSEQEMSAVGPVFARDARKV
jgi:hypothetical protein